MTSPAGEILVVDDERDLVWALEHSLRDEGYQVLVAYDGLGALRIAKEHRPDLVILDILMPLLDGLQVCCELRLNAATSTLPILFLTSRSLVMDRIRGLDSGGDDYLVKPFDLGELKARVRSLLRRARSPEDAPGISLGKGELSSATHRNLELDVLTRQVQVRGQKVQLTPTECALLVYLMTRLRQIFSSKQLARGALGYRLLPEDAKLVRWHIKNLRQKIEPDPQHPVYILTVPHQGYMLVNDILSS
jgi:DNA-binding response OmpR family regulator